MSEDSNGLSFEPAQEVASEAGTVAAASSGSAGSDAAGPLNVTELIVEYERAVYSQAGSSTMDALCNLTLKLFDHQGTGLIEYGNNIETLRRAYTRIASAVTAHAVSPRLMCSAKQYLDLSRRKLVLETIFIVSGFSTPDHLIMLRGAPQQGGQYTVSPEQAAFLALFFSLDNVPDSLFQSVMRFPHQMRAPLVLAWIAQSKVMTLQGEERRGRLLTEFQYDTSAGISEEMILLMVQSWMHCSYAEHPDKHQFKEKLNLMWKDLCRTSKLKSRFRRRTGLQRPTLLIAAERMNPAHAMHRCYGHHLSALKDRFHVILMVQHKYYVDSLKALFDEVILVDTNVNGKDVAAKLARAQADIIYYPSLGMADWTELTCNLRFAPIQIMTVGHPAPACSNEIDYVLVQNSHLGGAKKMGGRVVVRKLNGSYVPHPQIPEAVEAAPSEPRRAVNIAISAMAMKLSPRFLETCSEIEKRSSVEIIYHFFPSVPGVWMDNLKWSLKSRFKSCVIHNSMPYPSYLAKLAECDMALSPFPFGNTNTAVDYCVAGAPFIAFYGDEILSMCDGDIMDLTGLPSWMLARSTEEYIQSSLKLIEDASLRSDLRQFLLRPQTRSQLFDGQDEDSKDFADSIMWIYQNHEELIAKDRAVYRVGSALPIEA